MNSRISLYIEMPTNWNSLEHPPSTHCTICFSWRIVKNFCQFGVVKWLEAKICAQDAVQFPSLIYNCPQLVEYNDWSRWFVIGSLPLFAVPNFMFISGDGELRSEMSWMWEILLKPQISSMGGAALQCLNCKWLRYNEKYFLPKSNDQSHC